MGGSQNVTEKDTSCRHSSGSRGRGGSAHLAPRSGLGGAVDCATVVQRDQSDGARGAACGSNSGRARAGKLEPRGCRGTGTVPGRRRPH